MSNVVPQLNFLINIWSYTKYGFLLLNVFKDTSKFIKIRVKSRDTSDEYKNYTQSNKTKTKKN